MNVSLIFREEEGSLNCYVLFGRGIKDRMGMTWSFIISGRNQLGYLDTSGGV